MNSDNLDSYHFEELRQRARTAAALGELEHSLEICEEAVRWAERFGGQADLDLATINRNAAMLHLGHGDSVIRELQQILMRSADAGIRHLAAYNISVFYSLRDDLTKSFFYSRLALEHAERADSTEYLARSYNRLGNLQILKSKFSEALESYQKALDLFSDEQLSERLALIANIGYCHLVCGNFNEGFANLFTARRGYIRLKVKPCTALCRLRLSFCFGYLEIGRAHLARLHGAAGLHIAEHCGEQELVKKALYLVGEAEKLSGSEMVAFGYFARLQEEFYPDNPFIPELLLDNDTKQLINIWA